MKEQLYTERLILRKWADGDAEALYRYAKDPLVGPIAGWPVHDSLEYSRTAIREYLSAPGTYAVCLKEDQVPIGSAGLLFGEDSNLVTGEREAELGYWIGVPFWGRGLIPEACREILRYGFQELGLTKIWCAYFDGNVKSRKVQEKLGFTYCHTNKNIYWELLDDYRTEHVYSMTREQWTGQNFPGRSLAGG